MRKATKAQVRGVIDAIKDQMGFDPADAELWASAYGDGPQVHPSEPDLIIWEEGPYAWTYLFPHGGIEEEFGGRRRNVESLLDPAVWVEAQTSYSVRVIRHDA